MSARLIASGAAIAGRLEPCDLAFEGGTVTMLVGPNGAGKTSLLHALAGLSGTMGDIRVDGDAIATLSPAQRIRHLAFLGASREVRWPLRARDYIALGLPGTAHGDRADAALASLEASALAERRLDHLSTGERSRVMIARALAPQAGAVLLDEPCANLDPQWQLAILARLRSEAANGAAVILSIHDIDLARQHGDRAIVIDTGRIVADGVPSATLSDAIVAEVFGVAQRDGRWARV
ncbi:MAG: ABC transporter ATP-binding protein [Parasphingopyxis sp.]|uniref:ABC transporter ATP-binding protein n=1 Tax=Parasphingopyxis sp. TaxID=1920299 RepID=UPI003FA13A00